jgi:hypothetical protein
MHTSTLDSLLPLLLPLSKWVSFAIITLTHQQTHFVSLHIWRCHITHWLEPELRVRSAVVSDTRQCNELNRARAELAELVLAPSFFMSHIHSTLIPTPTLPHPVKTRKAKMVSGSQWIFQKSFEPFQCYKTWQDRRYECLIIKNVIKHANR